MLSRHKRNLFLSTWGNFGRQCSRQKELLAHMGLNDTGEQCQGRPHMGLNDTGEQCQGRHVVF